MTRLLCILIMLTPCAVPAQTYDNGSHWNYHAEISYPHFRFEPFTHNPLVIVFDTDPECVPRLNPAWRPMPMRVLIVTREWVVPYPNEWPLEDRLIEWCVADYSLMWEGLPVYFQWDFDANGHIDLSDLTFFGMNYELWGLQIWDLSDFSEFALRYMRRYKLPTAALFIAEITIVI